MAVLQSPGTHPVSRDLRKIIVTGTAISSHNAFNIRGDMLSAPAALSSFNFWSLLLILSTVTEMSTSLASHKLSRTGMSVASSFVNTDVNKSFNISALAFESLVSSPWLSAGELTFTLLLTLLLTYAKNDFLSSLILLANLSSNCFFGFLYFPPIIDHFSYLRTYWLTYLLTLPPKLVDAVLIKGTEQTPNGPQSYEKK